MAHGSKAWPLAFVVLVASCSGEIDSGHRPFDMAGGPAFGVGGAGGPPATAPGPMADEMMRAANPELFQLAQQYFPGMTASGGEKRLFRLTRQPLDLTTTTLLPASYMGAVADVMPGDPLQTNYEYSDNLSWNAANFTPYTTWVTEIAGRVRATPAGVIDCAAQTDTACL